MLYIVASVQTSFSSQLLPHQTFGTEVYFLKESCKILHSSNISLIIYKNCKTVSRVTQQPPPTINTYLLVNYRFKYTIFQIIPNVTNSN